MTTLAAILITALSSVEAYCIAWLIRYAIRKIQCAIDRSEQLHDQRMEMYRAIAYGNVRERRNITQNRQKLWRAFGK